MNIENKYIVDGIDIRRTYDGDYIVFTIPTQHFKIASLDELTNERFEIEIERQKQYEKDTSKLFSFSKEMDECVLEELKKYVATYKK